MTSVFLSYAREDLARARQLAGALEVAGYDLWWDRHVQAGESFGAQIEEQLDRADAVVVLWSKSAVRSSWVQDEASVGRDTARLVPLLLDATPPPLGFRQFQALDLSGWRGRAPPRLDEIAAAIDRTADKPRSAPLPATPTARLPALRSRTLAIALVIALVLAAVAALLWSGGQRGSTAPSVALVAGETGDAARSKALAQQLANDLGRLGSGSAGRLAVLGGDSRRAAKAAYLVRVAAYSDPAMSRADLSLTVPETDEILWSATFDRPAGGDSDLRQQAAVELTAVLSCLVESGSAVGGPLATDVLKVHLEGCARLADPQGGRMDEEAAIVYRFVTEKAPGFALGWASLALIEANAIPGLTQPERRAIWPVAIDHAARARKLDPKLGEVYAAEAALTLPGEWGKKIRLYDRGLLADPGHPLLLQARAQILMKVGRVNEAVDNARRALESDPLSPSVREVHISQLAYSGRPQAALKALEEAERTWPGATSVRDVRYRFDLRYGDPANALRLLKEQGKRELGPIASDPSWEAYLKARIDPSSRNVEAAVSAFMERVVKNRWDVVAALQALGEFGRIDQAYAILEPAEAIDGLSGGTEALFRPGMRGFRSDPRFMRVAHRLGLLDYWRQNQLWPDFCRDPGMPYDCAQEAAKYLRPKE